MVLKWVKKQEIKMLKKTLLLSFIVASIGAASAEEINITGNVGSKCVITTDTAGVYGNPAPNELTTTVADGGVPPVVRYAVSIADYYKAKITYPTSFSNSPSLSDTVTWTGSTEVSETSDVAMANYEANKVEYDASTEYDLTVAGSTWFKVNSTAEYGFDKAFPGGNYTATVVAECVAQ